MPVILGDKGSTDSWLSGSSTSNFDSLLKPYEGPDLVSGCWTLQMRGLTFTI